MNYFDVIFNHIIQNEGGYSDKKYDKGGKTKYGITEYTLKRAIRRGIVKPVDIKNLTIEQAKTIYYKRFWLPNHALNEIHDIWFKYLHFDATVNHGIKQATKFLQLAIEKANERYFFNNNIKFPIDGIFGMKSIMYYHYAVVEFKGELPLYYMYLSFRYNFYNLIVQHNKKQKVFLHGWLNRLQQFTERRRLNVP